MSGLLVRSIYRYLEAKSVCHVPPVFSDIIQTETFKEKLQIFMPPKELRVAY